MNRPMLIELHLRFSETDYYVVLRDEAWPSVETAAFYYTDGNGASDCSLADLIRRELDGAFPDLPCGDTIEMRDLVIDGVSAILSGAVRPAGAQASGS